MIRTQISFLDKLTDGQKVVDAAIASVRAAFEVQETPEDKTEYLNRLFALYDAAAKFAADAKSALKEFAGNGFTNHWSNAPKKPEQVEMLLQIEIYNLALTAFNVKANALKGVSEQAEKQRVEIEREIKKHLPYQVWVRVGNRAYGVAETNWGGYSSWLVAQDWSDKLPSLDHYYHGD